MSATEARAALDVGVAVADELLADGHDLLVTGDMGSATRRHRPPCRGADAGVMPARDRSRDGHRRRTLRPQDPGRGGGGRARRGHVDPVVDPRRRRWPRDRGYRRLRRRGRRGAAPVVVDGLIALTGRSSPRRSCPACATSSSPATARPSRARRSALEHLGLEPLLDLGLRLGEGTGACLAVPLVQAAARLYARWRRSRKPRSTTRSRAKVAVVSQSSDWLRRARGHQ